VYRTVKLAVGDLPTSLMAMTHIAPAPVRAALNDAPVSLRDLAAAAALSPSVVQMAASGKRPLSPAAAHRLATALDRLAGKATTAAATLRAYADRDA
jgi:hypothetical protein